jgi:hypothetical protein
MFNRLQPIAHSSAIGLAKWQFNLETCRKKLANHPAEQIFTCHTRLYTSLFPGLIHYFKFNKPGAIIKLFPQLSQFRWYPDLAPLKCQQNLASRVASERSGDAYRGVR